MRDIPEPPVMTPNEIDAMVTQFHVWALSMIPQLGKDGGLPVEIWRDEQLARYHESTKQKEH